MTKRKLTDLYSLPEKKVKRKKTKEKNVNKQLKEGLLKHVGEQNLKFQRHEDSFSPGIPDISYSIAGTNGWIESKYRETWPKLFRTQLEAEQAVFLFRGFRIAGFHFVFHRIGDDYLLYNGSLCYSLEGLSKGEVLKNKGVTYFQDSVDWNKLIKRLTK